MIFKDFKELLHDMIFQEKLIGVPKFDRRSEDEKKKDWIHEEVASSSNQSFNDSLFPSQIYQATIQQEDQQHVNDCVPSSQCFAIELQKYNSPKLSREFLYRLRSNYPDAGVYPQENAQRLRDIGTCIYDMAPNQEQEWEANQLNITEDMYINAFNNRIVNFLIITDISIDTLANISYSCPIVICIYATVDEWSKEWVEPTSKTVTLSNAKVRHSITIFPKSSFTKDGKKWITIGDSAYFGGLFHRYLSEDFINQRVYNALYFTRVEFNDTDKPKLKFGNKTLSFGMKNLSVAKLQKCLQYEKLFPTQSHMQPFQPTGYFGGLTLKAVKDFQIKYKNDILVPAGLKEPTGVVGKYTIKKLNELFA